jgi:hypothetical protein
VTVVATLSGVVLEQVSQHGRLGQVVDGNDLIALSAEHLTESEAADAAKAIDSNFYGHGSDPPFYINFYPEEMRSGRFSSLSNYIFYTKTVKYTRGFAKIFQNRCFAPPSQNEGGVFVHFAMVFSPIFPRESVFSKDFWDPVDKLTRVWYNVHI